MCMYICVVWPIRVMNGLVWRCVAVDFCAMTNVLCVLFNVYATRVRHTQPENCLTSYEHIHGYCVIYSSADRDSSILAERVLQSLWTSENIAQKAVILVGNKADLARSRTVTTEGKCFASSSSCTTCYGRMSNEYANEVLMPHPP